MASSRRSNITTAELLEALKNSGLPMGGSQDMKNASMLAPDMVRDQIRGQFDPAREAAKKKYMDAINKIADMDTRLGKLYASSDSPLYMENPMDRERALMGAENVGYKESSDAAREMEQVKQSQADAEADALKVYDELETLTSSLEKGQKAANPSKGKSSSKKKTLADLARLDSEEAVVEFNSYPLAFKRWFVNNVRGVEASDANKSGGVFFNPEDVASAYESYLEEQDRRKANKKSSSSLEDQVLKLFDVK